MRFLLIQDGQSVRNFLLQVHIPKQQVFIPILILLTLIGVLEYRMIISGETQPIRVLPENDHVQLDIMFRLEELRILLQNGELLILSPIT